MPLPIAPSTIKDLIPRPGGNFCEKFLKSLNLPSVVYEIYAYMFTEAGGFTDEFQADLCSLECKCGDGGVVVPGGLVPPIVSASDGQFSDRIMVTWNPPTGALQYDLYRSTTNATGGQLLEENFQGTSYEDTTVTPAQYYYYSVRAKNQFGASGFSNVDRGHAGAISTTLPMISDLVAGQGVRQEAPQTIPLVFSPSVGADSYDIYRSLTDDFSTATLIDSNRVPTDNTNSYSLGPAPYFVDNVGELAYFHDPGFPAENYYTKYYFWVIAKRSGPPAQSPVSNSGAGALGWAAGRGDGVRPSATVGVVFDGGSLDLPAAWTIQAGMVEAWVVLLGTGAGGAGGGPVHGGGGGGAAAVVTGKMAVVAGAKFRLRSVAPTAGTTNAASETNGQNGPQAKLQYSANGLFTDTVDVMLSSAPSGGVYNAGGAGAGGAGSTGSKDASVTLGNTYNGRAGRPGAPSKGGRSGYRFGEVRKPAAGNGSLGAPAGSGGNAHAVVPGNRSAGRGVNGTAYIVPYSF